MSYVKTAPKRYFWEVLAAAALLIGIVRLARFLAHASVNPALAQGARILVLLPVLLIGLAIHRAYRSLDEFQQQLMLKATATAALVALLLMMAYGPLSPLGLPHFSLIIGMLILAGSYIVVGTIFSFQQQKAMSGTKQAFVRLAPLSLVLLPAVYWALSLSLPLPPLSLRHALLLVTVCAVIASFWTIFVRPVDR